MHALTQSGKSPTAKEAPLPVRRITVTSRDIRIVCTAVLAYLDEQIALEQTAFVQTIIDKRLARKKWLPSWLIGSTDPDIVKSEFTKAKPLIHEAWFRAHAHWEQVKIILEGLVVNAPYNQLATVQVLEEDWATAIRYYHKCFTPKR